jgi:broad specificity phosphatase PhoE
MPVVLLVRHGQASLHAEDYDVLSETGREQARVVGEELRRRSPRSPVVVTGGLRRQRDTAAAALPEATPRVDERWDEYDHLRLLKVHASDSEYDGTARGLQAVMDIALARWIEERAHDGWMAFQERTYAALDDLVASLSPGVDAVVFTSGGVIATLAARLLGGGPASVVALNRVMVNGSVTKLAVGSSGPSLVAFNEHAHFEGERRALLTYR